MTIDLNGTLDIDSDEGKAVLLDLQGNILEPHKREHAMHLFVCFGTPSSSKEHKKNVEGALEWVSDLAKNSITTAADEIERTGDFLSLLLSSRGYDFLKKARPESGAFREGMRERRRK